MNYRSRADGRYPISLDEVRRTVNVAFGDEPTQDVLDAADVDEVQHVDAPTRGDGEIVREGEPEQLGATWRQTWVVGVAPPASPPTSDDVNAERDRRMVLGFEFNGKRFQSRPQDRENIMGAFALASTALTIGGKQPGDLRWHGGQSDFVFIAEDDSRVPMDAVMVLGLGQAAARQKSDLTFAASDLKKLDPIPADYADDAHWLAAD